MKEQNNGQRPPAKLRNSVLLAGLAGVAALSTVAYTFAPSSVDWDAKVGQWEQSIAAKVVGSPTPKTHIVVGKDLISAYDPETNQIFLNVPAAKPTPAQELAVKITWLHERAHALWHHVAMSDVPPTGMSSYLADIPVPKEGAVEERFCESFAMIAVIQTQSPDDGGLLRGVLHDRAQWRAQQFQMSNSGMTVVSVALAEDWDRVRAIPDAVVRDVAADVAVKSWAHDFRVVATHYGKPWPEQLSVKPGTVKYSTAPAESLGSIKHSLSATPNLDATYEEELPPQVATPRLEV